MSDSEQDDTTAVPSPLLDQIPILHVRGTHRTVGYTIGRQFRSMIENLLTSWTYFNEKVVHAYETSREARAIYDEALATCNHQFPRYVAELEGMADGCGVPFHKLFLLHIESVIVPMSSTCGGERAGSGCTSVIIRNEHGLFLGHTEDAMVEFANNVYIVAAEVVDEKDSSRVLEKFTTLTYAGHLPGYTMGFNDHFVYSVNTQFPVAVVAGKTPRTFLARAVLGATSVEKVLTILHVWDNVSDGFSFNVIFPGTGYACNIEIAPNPFPHAMKSTISLQKIEPGQVYAHCNKYRRLETVEHAQCTPYSENRHRVLETVLKEETDLEGLKSILSNCSDPEYSIFRAAGSEDCPVRTVAVGIFNLEARTWSIYMGPPATTKPVAVVPLNF